MPSSFGLGISAIGFGFLSDAVIPNGNVKSYPYSPLAVEFVPAASIVQNNSAIPDCLSFTCSTWHKRGGAGGDSDYLIFGIVGQSLLTIHGNSKIEFTVNGAVYSSGSDNIGQYIQTINVPGYVEAAYNHIFACVKCTNAEFVNGTVTGSVYINRVLVSTLTNANIITGIVSASPSGNGIVVNGNPIKVPPPYETGAQVLSDFQCWFGTYIDPAATLGITITAANPQPSFQGKPVDASLMQMFIDAMIAGGVDSMMMGTVYNIETQYGTVFDPPTSLHQGAFQFTQAEINAAGAVGSNFNNDANAQAFVFYNTVPGPDSWVTPALNQFGSDPTGINRYTVYNQGSPGARQIWAAGAGAKISSLPIGTQQNMIPLNGSSGQSWSNGGANNRWGPGFTTALMPNDLISTWRSRLQSVWDTASADFASRVSTTNLTNLNAFISPTGKPVAPAFASTVFGQQSVLFSGNKDNFPTNLGNGGPFTTTGPALLNFVPPPP